MKKINWATGSDEQLELIIVKAINMFYTMILLAVIMIALKVVMMRCF